MTDFWSMLATPWRKSQRFLKPRRKRHGGKTAIARPNWRPLHLEALEERSVPSLSTTPFVQTSTELALNTFVSGVQFTHFGDPKAVASDPDGNFVAVWCSVGQDGSADAVIGRRFDSFGSPLGPEFQVNTTTANNQLLASVAMDEAGEFVVVWASFGQDGDSSGQSNVYARRYDSSGVPLSGEFLVNSVTSENQTQPSIAMDPWGDFVVVWVDVTISGNNYFGRLYDEFGVAQGGQFQINTGSTGSSLDVDVAKDAYGDFVVVYSGADASGSGVYFRRFNFAGTAKDVSDVAINTTTALDQDLPSVDVDYSGNFVASWVSDGQDGSVEGIVARIVDWNGVFASPEFVVNTTTSGRQDSPSVAVDDDGDFVIAWNDYAGADGNVEGVYVRRYDAFGTAVGNDFLVNSTTSGAQERPSIAADRDNDFVIVWSGNGPGDGQGVFGQLLAFPTAISGQKFYDSNGNGVKDTNEPGLDGWTIELVDTGSGFVLATTVTSGGGNYSFFDLPPASYEVREVGQSGWLQTTPIGAFAEEFFNPTGLANQDFARQVAPLGADRILVAAPDAGAGAVYVFDIATGALLRTLVHPNPGAHTLGNSLEFGSSIAAVGTDKVLIGAEGAEVGGVADAGQVYLVDVNSGAVLRTFSNPSAGADDAFGFKVVVVSPSVIAIAADLDDPGGIVDAGTVYVFNVNDGTLIRTLANPTPLAGDQFGLGLAATDAGEVVIGAPQGEDPEGISFGPGKAYLFNAISGALLQTYVNPSPQDGDLYGISVAYFRNASSNGRVVIGAPGDDFVDVGFTVFDRGTVYIHDAATGTLISSVTDPELEFNDWVEFGGAVGTLDSAIGRLLVVGADGANDGFGRMSLFDLAVESDARFIRALVHPNPGLGLAFADYQETFATLGADQILIGVQYDDTTGLDAGAVFIFDVTLPGSYIVGVASGDEFTGLDFGNFTIAPGVGPEFLVNTTTIDQQGGDSAGPVVAMDDDGDFVVVWGSYYYSYYSYNGEFDVAARRYNALGEPQGDELGVNLTPNGLNPAVAMDADGDFVIVWQTYLIGSASFDIIARRFSSSGAALSGEIVVASDVSLIETQPTIAMEDNGDFVVAWSQGTYASGYDVYARRYDAAGNALGSAFNASGFTGNDNNPSVAMDADGDFIVVWDNDYFGARGVFARLYDSSGQFVDAFDVSNTTADEANPSVAMDADGDFVVSWEMDDVYNGSWNVRAQLYDRFGVASAPLLFVGHFTGNDLRPAVAMDADGDFVVGWDNDYFDYIAGRAVFVNRYDASGRFQQFLEISNSYADEAFAAVAMSATSQFVVARHGEGLGDFLGVFARLSANSANESDRFEPNDVQSTATVLGVVSGDRLISGLSIHNPTDEDWFSFTTVAEAVDEHTVRIEFLHSFGDLDLELYDATGALLAVSAGISDVEEILLDQLFAGTYFVRVFGFLGAINSYVLSIRAPEDELTAGPDFAEENDTRLTAFDLGTLASDEATILDNLSVDASGDDDWFTFVSTGFKAGDYVGIDFQHRDGDLDLELYDAGGVLLVASDSTANQEQIDFGNLPGGTYYIRVLGYQGETNPDYTLTVQSTGSQAVPNDWIDDANQTPPNNDTFVNAFRLEGVGGVAFLPDLTIDAGDVDVFRFTTFVDATADNFVVVQFANADGNLDLELYDSGEVLIDSSTTSADGEAISLANRPAGTYYLRVIGVSGATNRYELFIDAPFASVDDWTILMYMTAADRNGYAFADVNELEAAAARLPSSVNIALLYDQSADRVTFPTGNGGQSAWGGVGRAFIEPDVDRLTIATSFEFVTSWENTGNPNTLIEFVEWAAANGPAARYALVVWGQGSGVFGVINDAFDTSGGQAADVLSISEIESALESLFFSVGSMELVALDAGMMAMTEVVHALTPFANAIVGSEDVVQDRGFDYSTAFSVLEHEPANTLVEELATEIVLSYNRAYSRDFIGPRTLSGVSTNAMSELVQAISGFTFDALSTPFRTTTVYNHLRNARSGVQAFHDEPQFDPYRDLGQFMRNIVANSQIPQQLRIRAQGVLDALANVVIALAQDPGGSTGLSIYLPAFGATIDAAYISEYGDFFAGSGWLSFLQAFVSPSLGLGAGPGGDAGGTGDPFEADWAEQNNSPGVAWQLHTAAGANTFPALSLHSGSDQDWFRFRIEATGATGNQITVSDRSGTGQTLSVTVFDETGTGAAIRQASGTTQVVISLSSLPADTYTLRIMVSGGTGQPIGQYTVSISAPQFVGTGADWASGNNVAVKAEPLGQITGHSVLAGLTLEPGVSDWFAFSASTADTATQKLRIRSNNASSITVELRNPITDALIRTATGQVGATYVDLDYESGTGQAYSLRLSSTSGSVVSYQLEFRPAATTFVQNDIVGRWSQTGQWWVGQSTGSSFTNRHFGNWSPSATWVDVQVADVNNDGLDDVLGRWSQTGQWWAGRSTGTAFNNTFMGVWSTGATWVDVRAGDIDADGDDDVIGRWSQTGQWWVGRSNGSAFTNALLGIWSTAATWVDVQAGDIDADGDIDIIGRWLQTGQWWLGRSNGTTITSSLLGIWSPGATWVDVRLADLNGDGRVDVLGRWQQTGQWWAGISNGTTIANTFLGSWSPAVTWVDVRTGDVTGDGRADIVGRVAQFGQWWVGVSTGATISSQAWGTWSPSVTWVDTRLADVNADGRADVIGRYSQTGQWWVGVSSGAAFSNQFFGQWASSLTWTDVQAGNFDVAGGGAGGSTAGSGANGGTKVTTTTQQDGVNAALESDTGESWDASANSAMPVNGAFGQPTSSSLSGTAIQSSAESLSALSQSAALSPEAVDLVFSSERSRTRATPAIDEWDPTLSF